MTHDQRSTHFLDDIRRVFEQGERDYGVDLINAYLEEHPGDVDAEFLKAELCLQLDRDPDFIGEHLNRWRQIPALADRVTPLQTRAEALVRTRLSEGRNKLQGRSLGEALDRLRAAVALAPWDPAIPLAAGLALYQVRQRFGEDDAGPFGSAFRDLERLAEPPMVVMERHFRLALERSAPGESTFATAFRHLIQHYLAQGELVKALDLLANVAPTPPPGELFSALAAEVSATAVEVVLTIAASFLRMNQDQLALRVLDACADVSLPALSLLRAEQYRRAGQPDAAIAEYRSVLESTNEAPIPPLDRVRALWDLAWGLNPLCPQCGKPTEVGLVNCSFCGVPFENRTLAIDLIDEAPKPVLAHIGLAETLASVGRLAEAAAQLEAAFAALPDSKKIPEVLKQRRQQWAPRIEFRPSPVQDALEAWAQNGLTGDTLSGLNAACEKSPQDWTPIPLKTRSALTRQLIKAEHLHAAQIMLNTAFGDRADSKTVSRLKADLSTKCETWTAGQLRQARQALDSGQPDSALGLVEAVLALEPGEKNNMTSARLIKGQALLALGQDLPALAAFRAIIGETPGRLLDQSARLGAARALENQHDFTSALTVLADTAGDEVAQVRARLNRCQRGEPVFAVRQESDLVMHDTLNRETGHAQWHTLFAVALRAVSRPWNQPAQEWNNQIMTASYEFVQVIGGLRHTAGDPVFALRLISHPHPHIPERGRLSIAFLVRVTAPEQAASETLAMNLWRMLRDMLPCSHAYIYSFEPVADDGELASLLVPFEAADIAEIVHREELKQDEESTAAYTTYPFTIGSVDLHNLCWAMLRQPAPAMVSLHLLPTDLMPWEQAAFEGVMVGGQVPTAIQIGENGMEQDPFAQWLQTRVNRAVADSLRLRAFVLRINVAGAEASHPLLPEMVATAMFGPAQDSRGMSQGGYEIIRAGDDRSDEGDIARRNLALVDVEGWVYSAAPGGSVRLRHLVSEHEAALIFRLPIPGAEGIPGLPLIDARAVAPPAHLPGSGTMLGESTTRIGGVPLRITQAANDRRRHTYIVGKTGVGKSTLLQNLALQDIEAGHGLCLIDPHGDLVEEVLARIPAHRAGDVILFDPSDEERPIGLNLLDARSESEKHRVVTEFIGLLVRMYDPSQQGIVGPRFQHNVRNAMLTVMSVEGSTMIEVVRALTDSHFVQGLLPHVKDPLVRNYWEKQIAQTSDFHKSEVLDYIVSKFSRFVGDRLVRNIVGQRQTTLDFRQIMDRRQILLVNLAKGKIGPESAQFLGLLLVQSLLLTALSRADVTPDKRPDFFLYVDEFQNFATDLFATVLSEGRKYGIAAIVANQYLTQLDREIRDAIFGNVGSIVSFRLGTQDAVVLAPEMYPVFGPDDLLNLPKYTACVKLLVDGIAGRPFTMRTVLDTRPINPQRAEAIRQASRQIYGRPASDITDDVLARFAA